MNRQKREPSNPLPTPCQRGTNPLPTGCVLQPPITPMRWNRPTQGWNPAGPFDRLKAQRKYESSRKTSTKTSTMPTRLIVVSALMFPLLRMFKAHARPSPLVSSVGLSEQEQPIRQANFASSTSSRGWAASAVAIACIQASQSELVRMPACPVMTTLVC